MFRLQSIFPPAAALAAALLVFGASPAPAAPGGYTGGYAPGYFSSQHGGYFPGYYGGRPSFGGYYPGYFTGYPSGYGGNHGLYYPGYFSALHAESTYPSPTVTTAPYYGPPTVESSGGRTVLPEVAGLESVDPSQTGGGAVIDVHVPADAKVWFDGDLTKKRGGERDFTSPPLPVGRLYHYDVRARWKEGGRVVDQTRRVPASANRRTVVDFSKPDPNAAPPR